MYVNIDHVVIVVSDLDRAVEVFRDRMGLPLKEVREIPRSRVRVAFFPVGHGNIEVIQPLDPESPAGRFLARHGDGLYMISLETGELDQTLEHLKGNGIPITRSDLEPPAGAGRRRAYPDPGVTMGTAIQLIEGKNRYAAIQ
ncbi:MAG: VOC family protein [Dehalococcoidia bacterium]